MKKDKYVFWYFPFCFFVFLAIYTCVKFVFIFFFRAAFEPEFIFDLTPYYILSGVNNLHSLFLSIIVIIFDVYFHIKVSKKNLIFSFLPTGVMLCGLGLEIASRGIVISNFFHYLIFGCLLVIVLIDHKHILMFPEITVTPKKEPVATKIPWYKSTIAAVERQAPKIPVFGRRLRIEGGDEILTLHKETLSDLRAMIKDDLPRVATMIEELERKTKKIDRMGEEIEERRKNLIQEERLFRRRFISLLDKNIYVKSSRSNNRSALDIKKSKETTEHYVFIDNIQDCVAILQQGILKKVNRRFAKLLGYNMNKVVGKSLFDFVTPECFLEIKKYYQDRSKGVGPSVYKTVFLTKDNNKLPGEVSIRPTIFNNEKAEVAIIKKIGESNKKINKKD